MRQRLFFTAVSLVSGFGMVVFGAAATASHQISSMATRLLHDLDRLEKEKANTEQQTATILRGPWKKQEEDATNKDTPSDGDSPA